MRDSNLEFRIVDRGPMPEPSNFGYAAIISLESGLLSKTIFISGFDLSTLEVRSVTVCRSHSGLSGTGRGSSW